MLKVSNKKCINHLAIKSFKASKFRNLIAVMAIALTCILFTSLFIIGGSLLSSIQNLTMRQVGTSSHAGFKYLTQEQYDTVAKDPKLKDISYSIIVGFGENPEFKKTPLEIRYAEEKEVGWSFNTPTTGTLPKKTMDVAVSTGALDTLNLPHELGTKMTLEFTANGVKHSDVFTLCGFWEGDIALGIDTAYVSREYSDKVAPVVEVPWYEKEEIDMIYMAGTISPSLWFATSWDIEGQMEALVERCGFDERVDTGVNWAYASSTMDISSIMLVLALLLIITWSGYLIIYNIFYISITKDVRFYGLLKTIGTTKKQLKRIVHRQALFLGAIGLVIGLPAGLLIGKALVPIVMAMSSIAEDFIISVNPWIFVISGMFTLITVWLSCIKPCRLVSKISPVEATRYVETSKIKKASKKTSKTTPFFMAMANLKRGKKKTISVVLSLSLSLILLTSTYTVINGFDLDKYVSRSTISDFIVTDASIMNEFSTVDIHDGVTPEITAEMKRIDGVENIGNVYMKESEHKLNEEGMANTEEIIKNYADKMPNPNASEEFKETKKNGIIGSHIYGVDEFVASKIEAEQGEIDYEKLATGQYVIVSYFDASKKVSIYNIGDKVTVEFGEGKTKEYEVLALADLPYAVGPNHVHNLDVYFTFAKDEYIAQTGSANALNVVFDVADNKNTAAEEFVANYCENINTDMDYKSKSIFVQEFEGVKSTFVVVGGALSFILALIGVLNFINSTVTSLVARKQELATLQSIGMTNKQLSTMLVWEGLLHAILTVLVVVTIGSVITYGLVSAIAGQIWFFTYHFTLLPILYTMPILAVLAFIIPYLAHKQAQKQSIVERLRETE